MKKQQKTNLSLSKRLLIGNIAWVVAVVFIVAWALSGFFRQYTLNKIESELNLHINQLISAINIDEDDKVNLKFELNDPRFTQPLSGLYWQIDRLDDNGILHKSVLSSRSLWDQILNTKSMVDSNKMGNLLLIRSFDGKGLLSLIKVIAPTSGTADFRLIMALDQHYLDDALDSFHKLLFVLLGGLILLLSLTALFMQLFSLKPLRALRNDLEQVKSGRQSFLSNKYPAEIQPLVDEFNQVLKNNANFIDQARAHAGNLAHALKTPLTVMSNVSEQSDSELAHLVQEQVQTARRHVDHHLARAKAIATFQSTTHSTDVLPVIKDIEKVLKRVHADKNVVINYEGFNRSYTFKGEKQDLQEIIGNVLENAFKWTNDSIFISATTLKFCEFDSRNNSLLKIIIQDNGQGIDDSADYDVVFQRGVRLDERVTGSGLGMSIVQDLVDAYDGNVSAEKSMYGGLAVHIVLPIW